MDDDYSIQKIEGQFQWKGSTRIRTEVICHREMSDTHSSYAIKSCRWTRRIVHIEIHIIGRCTFCTPRTRSRKPEPSRPSLIVGQSMAQNAFGVAVAMAVTEVDTVPIPGKRAKFERTTTSRLVGSSSPSPKMKLSKSRKGSTRIRTEDHLRIRHGRRCAYQLSHQVHTSARCALSSYTTRFDNIGQTSAQEREDRRREKT